jgi:hypothetical protein
MNKENNKEVVQTVATDEVGKVFNKKEDDSTSKSPCDMNEEENKEVEEVNDSESKSPCDMNKEDNEEVVPSAITNYGEALSKNGNDFESKSPCDMNKEDNEEAVPSVATVLKDIREKDLQSIATVEGEVSKTRIVANKTPSNPSPNRESISNTPTSRPGSKLKLRRKEKKSVEESHESKIASPTESIRSGG